MRMRTLTLVAVLGCALLTTGCVKLKLGTDKGPGTWTVEDAGRAYAKYSGIESYNGTIAHARLLSAEHAEGELLSIGIWPLAQLDLGLLGVRAKLLGAEAAAGTLFYRPGPLLGDVRPGGMGIDTDR